MKNLKVFATTVEKEALEQINTLMNQKAFEKFKVRIMPDVHAGNGCVIGFTANLGKKVIPNVVGVDIGCGMLTVMLGKMDIDLTLLDRIIRENIPHGYRVHDGGRYRFKRLNELKCIREIDDLGRVHKALGSLGGGNHFIEVDKDDEGNLYLIIHSGSRNLGKQVASIYQKLAIDLHSGKDKLFEERDRIINEYKELGKKKEIEAALKALFKSFNKKELGMPEDLCYLEGKYRDNYLHDMELCQEYAAFNREYMALDILMKLFNTRKILIEHEFFEMENKRIPFFQTIHNYIDLESNIVRKGAISAKKNEILLIPINMRDGCILGTGKGNRDWNYSAPHGAGRLMSRGKAKATLNLEDFKKTMEGIYSTSVNLSTLDEAPFAYKPIEDILSNINDTVDIIKILKPIYNFKSSKEQEEIETDEE